MLDTLKTTLDLNNPGLLREQAYINGEWISAPDGQTFEVTNPADGSLVANVPELDVVTTRQALEATSQTGIILRHSNRSHHRLFRYPVYFSCGWD